MLKRSKIYDGVGGYTISEYDGSGNPEKVTREIAPTKPFIPTGANMEPQSIKEFWVRYSDAIKSLEDRVSALEERLQALQKTSSKKKSGDKSTESTESTGQDKTIL
jgi:uncharacterized protein (DUF342 family)